MAVLQTDSNAVGGFLVDPIFRQEVDALVRARSVFMTLATTPPPVNRRVVHLHKVATGPTLGFIREGSAKPVTDLSFARDTVQIHELAGLVIMSERLDAESFANPRSIVRQEIADAAAAQIDAELFEGTGDTDQIEIDGLVNLSGALTVTRGEFGDLGEDLRGMLRKVRAQNHEPNAFCVHSTIVDGLMAIRTSDDMLKYPTAALPQPTLWGKPLVVANNLATSADTDGTSSTVFLCDWRRVLVFSMLGSYRVSDVASYDSGGGLVSAFQRDELVIRAVQNVSSPIVQRPSAVCICTGAVG